MAVVTNVRAYAITHESTAIKWTDNGGASNDVYRSTDGSSYSEVASNIALGDEVYVDDGLDSATKYWYKITNDNGSTFSAVVTVYTHQCNADITVPSITDLPKASGESPSAKEYNQAMENLEVALRKEPFVGGDGTQGDDDLCVSCPADGRLVLDCTRGCDAFSVEITEDTTINSVSLIGCGPCPPVSIFVAINKILQLCGWPSKCPFDGDECYEAPLLGGATGRTFQASSGTSTPGSSGSASGDDVCDCNDVSGGSLGLACCTDSYTDVDDEDLGAYICYDSLLCGDTDPLGADYGTWIHLTACHGQTPYYWSFGGANVSDFPTQLQFFDAPNGTCIGDRDGIDGPLPPIAAAEVWVHITHLGYSGAPCSGFTDLYVRVTDSSLVTETADYILLP